MSQVIQEKIFPQATLQKSTINLRTYTGEHMKVVGELHMTVIYGGQSKQLPLYIVPGSGLL